MKVLVDSDALCKLAAANLLGAALELLESDLNGCRRLAALPWMLRRGGLAKRLGPETCAHLLPTVEGIAAAPEPSPAWLEQLAADPNIDPGEALLCALAAEHQLLIVTGDKRALTAVRSLPEVATALSGRVVLVEAVLIALCRRIGTEQIRADVACVLRLDTMLGVCFAATVADPVEALETYLAAAARDLEPLKLWRPDP